MDFDTCVVIQLCAILPIVPGSRSLICWRKSLFVGGLSLVFRSNSCPHSLVSRLPLPYRRIVCMNLQKMDSASIPPFVACTTSTLQSSGPTGVTPTMPTFQRPAFRDFLLTGASHYGSAMVSQPVAAANEPSGVAAGHAGPLFERASMERPFPSAPLHGYYPYAPMYPASVWASMPGGAEIRVPGITAVWPATSMLHPPLVWAAPTHPLSWEHAMLAEGTCPGLVALARKVPVAA